MQRSSRPYDPYGMGMTGPSPAELAPGSELFPDQTLRYDRMPAANGSYGYDLNAAQTWNANAFSTGAGGAFSPMYASTARGKTSGRGRAPLPNVSLKPSDGGEEA